MAILDRVIDLGKVLIERILSWPVVFLCLWWILRAEIRSLLKEFTLFFRRATQVSFRHRETSVQATAEAATQAKATPVDSAEGALIVDAPGALERTPRPAEKTDEKSRIIAHGQGVASVQYRESLIRADLGKLGLDLADRHTVDLLIRQFAVQQCLALFERIYRLIFGSQLNALDFANSHGPVTAQTMNALYEAAKSQNQEFYRTYSFDEWLNFMVSQYLLTNKGDTVEITFWGKDFLVWMVNTGVTREKPF